MVKNSSKKISREAAEIESTFYPNVKVSKKKKEEKEVIVEKQAEPVQNKSKISKELITSVQKKSKISKDMNIAEIIQKHPEAREKLMGLGLGCVGCHFAAFDTLENGANIHGMDVDDILDELND